MTLEKAREWASRHDRIRDVFHPDAKAAVEVIQSLPDKWVDAEKVQDLIDLYKNARDANKSGSEGWAINDLVVGNLESLITPKLPTLADMTAEEREACRRMQCMIADDTDEYCVLITVDNPCSRILLPNGASLIWNNDLITPLPDLPKLEWPGGEPVEKHGNASLDPQENFDASVEYVKTVQSSPEPKEDEVWIVEEEQGGRGVGRFAGEEDEFPWFILLDRGTYDNYKMGSVTPICRMVPETHSLPEGMRFADHETFGRIIVSPREDSYGYHLAYFSDESTRCGSDWIYLQKSEFTYLDGETK